jgi:Mg/Co/Ni transporter MgtE
MEPDEADPVRQLLKYTPGTAGSVMTSEPIILPPDATVAEALARIREPQLSPAVAAQVFVTRAPLATPTGRYLGMVHFQRLLREPPAELLGAVVANDIDPLQTATPLPEITRRMATYDLVGMPVVDATNRLVGAVTVDDVLDHSLPRDWRDRDATTGTPPVEAAVAGGGRPVTGQPRGGAADQPGGAGQGDTAGQGEG